MGQRRVTGTVPIVVQIFVFFIFDTLNEKKTYKRDGGMLEGRRCDGGTLEGRRCDGGMLEV